MEIDDISTLFILEQSLFKIKKMKKYTLAFIALSFVFSLQLKAQNFSDALRYSSLDPIGTARFMGAGSALSALGADFSVMSTNPAGIAWMRKGEFMITPGIYSTTVESELINDVNKLAIDNANVQFTLPNIGLVTHSRGGSSVEAFNFAIGVNRLADFNEQFYFKGKSKGSIVQRFEELANTNGLDNFEAGVAHSADALINISDGVYVSDFSDLPNAESTKEQTVIRSGSLSELAFGFAVNQDNNLLWGLSLGMPILQFEENKSYYEEDVEDEVEIYDRLRYEENLLVNGTGINLKLGFIYRVNQALRVSAAVHTPTYYQFDETFDTSMDFYYTDQGVALEGHADSPIGEFSYNMRTPWRFLGGVGTVFGKTGFLSGEIEYVNYAKNRFLFDGFSDDEVNANQGIKNNLSDAIKLKIGGEMAFGTFRVRGGFSTQQAPIVDDESFYNSFSFGIGMRQKKYYLDLGYRRAAQKSTYTPYQVTNGTTQYVDNDFIKENIALTLGFRF